MSADIDTGGDPLAEQLLKSRDLGFTFRFWIAMLAGLTATQGRVSWHDFEHSCSYRYPDRPDERT